MYLVIRLKKYEKRRVPHTCHFSPSSRTSSLPRAAPLRPKRASVLREAVAVSSPSVRSAEEIPLSLPRTAEERKEEIGSSLESRATKKVADTDAFTVVFFYRGFCLQGRSQSRTIDEARIPIGIGALRPRPCGLVKVVGDK